jgi:Fic family protein
VIRAIVLHLWLGYDHPFEDGNGRTARALFYWSMLRQGYWMFEFISISAILRRASAQYGRSFLNTETDELDATYFVTDQLDVILRALKALEKYLERKTREIQAAEQVIKGSGQYNYRQLALLGHALRNPQAEYTIRSHRVSHDVSRNTVRTDLMDLERLGLFEKRMIGNAAHFFVGERLRDLMSASQRGAASK